MEPPAHPSEDPALDPDKGDEAAERLAPRDGFDESFIPGHRLRLPRLLSAVKNDAYKLSGSPFIPYTHFSVVLSTSRKLPRLVAWNIDGGRIRRLSRKGIKFRTDPRIPRNVQTDNAAYKNNNLDRGHIARRADLLWGTSREARRANRDSFYYTNIAPQHARFNQSSRHGLWGKLENAIFEDTDVEDLKISVMAGPIFKSTDIAYREIQVPSDYWKLIAYRDSADGQVKARAYILTQDDLLNDIEALDLDPFRLWQIAIDDLETRIDIRFRDLANADTISEDLETLTSEVLPSETLPGATAPRVREIVE